MYIWEISSFDISASIYGSSPFPPSAHKNLYPISPYYPSSNAKSFPFPMIFRCSDMPRYRTCANWECGVCKKRNATSGNSCISCGAPKSRGKSLDLLPGDWRCSFCKESNFAKRKVCYKCGRDKVRIYCKCEFNSLELQAPLNLTANKILNYDEI